MGKAFPVPAESPPDPGATLALGIRLARALRHRGDRDSALRTVADVLSAGLDAPVIAWRSDEHGQPGDIVRDRRIPRLHVKQLERALAAPRSASPVQLIGRAMGGGDATVLDLGYGLVVIGCGCRDAELVGRELAAALQDLPDLDFDPPGDPEAHDVGRTRLRSLSPREREVLALIEEGSGTEAMARRLAISTKTVKTHVQNILAKLGARSRLEAAALSRRHRLSA
jgi:DNA-binding CsgD family transcriptional regulator